MMHDLRTVETIDVRLDATMEASVGAEHSASELDMVVEHVFDSKQVDANALPSNEDLLHVARLVTVGELSACFAHEVFNPLMLIRGHLRFIDEGLAPDHPARINFEVIDRASRRIEDMARRMLDFSRKRSSEPEACDVGELIADSLRFVQPYLQEQYADVKVSIAAGLPRVQVDRGQMVQAMVNLLQNAAEAMSNSDVRNLSVVVNCDGNTFRISVGDSGRGIERDDLSHIFTPFFTTKGERGTGLGLYITRKIVEEHHGTISVKTGSRGTTFVISLPLHQ